MLLFLKQDLLHFHYAWTDETPNTFFSGTPSRRLFDRFNGNQVLFVINYYGSKSDKFTVAEGHQIEEKILKELPAGVKSEISVYNWLKEASITMPGIQQDNNTPHTSD